MGTIKNLIRRVEKLDIDKVSSESIVETKETIADLNVEQMMAGLRADGSEILPSYKDVTIELKKLKGQPTDRVYLRDTGAFHAATFVDVSGSRITIGSRDPKSDKLNKKYSKARGSIHGLGGKFKQGYIDETLQPVFMKKIKSAIGLK